MGARVGAAHTPFVRASLHSVELGDARSTGCRSRAWPTECSEETQGLLDKAYNEFLKAHVH